MENTELTLKDKVYSGITDMLASGELVSGDIITEKKMIETFNFSKSPVREALLELCKDGVLVSIPRCGYQVTQVSLKTLHEVTNMRLTLELENFREICDKFDATAIDFSFGKLLMDSTSNHSDVWQANENNTNFHMTLARLSGNELRTQFIRKTLDIYSRAYAQMYITIPRIINPTKVPAHENFIKAWKEGKYDEAENYLKQDIIMARKELELS